MWWASVRTAPVACGAHGPPPRSPARFRTSTGSSTWATWSGRCSRPTSTPGTCASAGHEVLYICATDEHGTPAELAAKEAGLPVAEFCRSQHEVQKDDLRRLRAVLRPLRAQLVAAEPRAHPALRAPPRRATASSRSGRPGRCTRRSTAASCPTATSWAPARTAATKGPRRPVRELHPRAGPHRPDRARARRSSGSTDLEVRETKHLFLLQSKLPTRSRPGSRRTPRSGRRWPRPSPASGWPRASTTARSPATSTGACRWPTGPASRARSSTSGSTPRSSTSAPPRSGRPLDPSGRDWRSWWYEADDVEYTQFMAKDNVPFHTVMFPATLLGDPRAVEEGRLHQGLQLADLLRRQVLHHPEARRLHGRGAGILPADYWRYFLIANAPESSDSSFTWERFAVTVNKDLADTFGNFVNRCLTLRPSTTARWCPPAASRAAREAAVRRATSPSGARPTPSYMAARSCASPPTSCAAAGRWPTRTGSRAEPWKV